MKRTSDQCLRRAPTRPARVRDCGGDGDGHDQGREKTDDDDGERLGGDDAEEKEDEDEEGD